ncbi:MAG: flagellar hook-associated protein FlgL [Burkholderiales bacterium]
MRISTAMIYGMGIESVQQRQQDMLRLQQQLATGQRILVPSDDPVASATALDLKQSQALNSQYQLNGGNAISQLTLEEGALATVTSVLQDVRTLAVYAGNASLGNSDRAALAVELKSRYDELLAVANHGNGNGQYLFSGYQGATQPFAQASPGNVAYAGDDGQRMIQIGPSRTIPINDSGNAVFLAIKNGNGVFAAAPGALNTGGGIISPGTVTNPASWNAPGNPKDFTIKFHVSGSVASPQTTYDIVDNVNNISLLTGAAPGAGPYLRAYTAGSTISLKTQAPPDTNATPFDYGAMVTVEGAPANGDTFSVKASVNRDVFSTMHDLITALQSGVTANAGSAAAYQNSLNASMLGLDNALENVLKVRADIGARLKEVDTEQSAGADLSLHYDGRLSELQELDYAKAISELTMQQTQLDAAQKSFLKVTSLNLFSLL